MKNRRFFLAVVLGAATSLGTGCLTPPVLIEARWVDMERASALYPEGTEPVEVLVESDKPLSGFFVPAGEGAPVVLHLLESSGSVGSLMPPKGQIARDYANLGFASLLLDYRGVGASPGKRSPDHLAADARAMYAEAVRRAGSPDRVLIRAHSIGTVALALLLQQGARPGGIVALSPVDARTVVHRFARKHHGWWASLYARIAFQPAAKVDVYRELHDYDGPLLVILSEEDELIRKSDIDRLRSDTTLHLVNLGDHITMAGFLQSAPQPEIAFVAEEIGLPPLKAGAVEAVWRELSVADREHAEEDPVASSRITAALPFARHVDRTALAAIAPELDDPIVAYRWLRLLERGGPPPPFEVCRKMVASDLGVGSEYLDSVEMLSQLFCGTTAHQRPLAWLSVRIWLQCHLGSLELDGPAPPLEWKVHWRDQVFSSRLALSSMMSSRLNDGDLTAARRRVAAVLLLATGIPCQPPADQDGGVVVEYWENGKWQPLRTSAVSSLAPGKVPSATPQRPRRALRP